MSRNNGFTLIELSIVLVVIGLIAGVIVGSQQMIANAEIRKAARQPQEFNIAVNTFRTKYNCIPGDCYNGAELGFSAITGMEDEISGDGSAYIGMKRIAPNVTIGTEYYYFWNHLKDAGLLSFTGSYVVGNTSPISIPVNVRSGIGLSGKWIVYYKGDIGISGTANFSDIPMHFYILGGWRLVMPAPMRFDHNVLRPEMAYQLDAKADDGMPATGSVRAGPSESFFVNPITIFAETSGAAGSANCVNSDETPTLYNLSYTDYACNILFKASF